MARGEVAAPPEGWNVATEPPARDRTRETEYIRAVRAAVATGQRIGREVEGKHEAELLRRRLRYAASVLGVDVTTSVLPQGERWVVSICKR